MKYRDVQNTFRDQIIFSVNDLKKIDNHFYNARLTEWQKKGYIKKILKNYYIHGDIKLDEQRLFFIANKIYSPSYISLESALSYYGLIPETVYSITSVTTKVTVEYQTKIGRFMYRSLQPRLLFGYTLISLSQCVFKIAEIEKVLLDYFYLNPHLKTENDFFEWRFNGEDFLKTYDEKKLLKYLQIFNQKTLEKRILSFLHFLKNA